MEIDISTLSKEDLKQYRLVDIREPREWEAVQSFECDRSPLSQMSADNLPFDKERKYLIFCARGVRSKNLVEQLHELGYKNTLSVIGGIGSIEELFAKQGTK
jgi:rhodanese-related sulfurtransferase